jgi:hypothetical protein
MKYDNNMDIRAIYSTYLVDILLYFCNERKKIIYFFKIFGASLLHFAIQYENITHILELILHISSIKKIQKEHMKEVSQRFT